MTAQRKTDQGDEPPQSQVCDNSACSFTNEWVYRAFVIGLFVIIAGRALVFP